MTNGLGNISNRFRLSDAVTSAGLRKSGRYLPLQDDISSVAYWYQTLPCTPFPKLGNTDDLETI